MSFLSFSPVTTITVAHALSTMRSHLPQVIVPLRTTSFFSSFFSSFLSWAAPVSDIKKALPQAMRINARIERIFVSPQKRTGLVVYIRPYTENRSDSLFPRQGRDD